LSSRMDDEGKATEKKVLVDKGVLKEFLYDCYTAKKEGRESNGSASRGSYSSLPKVGASNFILSCKESSTIDAELVINGLIGAHTSNSITGDFSVEVSNAYLKDKPVKKAIISGNVFELIKNISAFGKDKKQFSKVVSPSIEFENIRVVG
ncbi:MAG TPA: TldD/PmbA family protein, partial [Euryarchaeota archaeon]|nr:TldD/PmbA family protein [Euryarchaeota archaeon]